MTDDQATPVFSDLTRRSTSAIALLLLNMQYQMFSCPATTVVQMAYDHSRPATSKTDTTTLMTILIDDGF